MSSKKNSIFLKDKRSQIGETITWIIATIIIIVILLFSIFISTSYLGGHKQTDFSKSNDILASKSFFAYLLTEDSEGQMVYEQLKNQENLNDFNGNLAIKIFKEFYGEEYPKIWVGFIMNRPLLPYVKNNYFGERPSTIRGGDLFHKIVPHIIEHVSLNKDKSIELVLAPKT